jgi:hypothetical protein
MREKFARFMMGRNGPDEFTRALSFTACILVILNLFLSSITHGVLWIIALVLLIYCYFRMFSRNVYKRRAENAKYLQKVRRAKRAVSVRKDMWRQRKTYKFFKCPSCKSRLRVPKGKGRVRVVCRKCGNAFEKNT